MAHSQSGTLDLSYYTQSSQHKVCMIRAKEHDSLIIAYFALYPLAPVILILSMIKFFIHAKAWMINEISNELLIVGNFNSI